jgi:hypothetical protein
MDNKKQVLVNCKIAWASNLSGGTGIKVYLEIIPTTKLMIPITKATTANPFILHLLLCFLPNYILVSIYG